MAEGLSGMQFIGDSMSGFFGKFGLWFIALIFIGILGIVLYLRSKGKLFPSYPIRVERQIITQHGAVRKLDSARFIQNEERPSGIYELKSTKEQLPAPKFKDFVSNNYLGIFTNNRGENFPMKLIIDAAGVANWEPVMDEAIKIVTVNQMSKTFQKYIKNPWWQNVLPIAVFGMFVFISLILFFSIAGKFESAAGSLAGGCDKVATMCIEACNHTQGQVIFG